jgi:hypothetical protein
MELDPDQNLIVAALGSFEGDIGMVVDAIR